jgi:hypothetical protein
MADSKSDIGVAILSFGFLAMIFGCGGCVSWYRAGVQQDVYRRSGIEMTQWEIFIGAKTPERAIRIEDGR